MNDRAFLSVFTPSRTAPEDLEAIFVQRQALLADAVERVRESAMTGNKHHQLFVGPRGTGKTHFVTLLVYRLSQDTSLQERLHIAWLNEDETSTTLLEFLRRIYLALVKRYPGDYSEAALDPIYELDVGAATLWLQGFLLECLQNRTLLVVVENLDALFEGLGPAGQKPLRAFIQEHPVFAIVATAQRLVDDIAKRSSVFFGFFQTEWLEMLTVEEAAELLVKIAQLNRQHAAAAFLRSPLGRARIRALHHLSGGNHRIYLVLSQFITDDNIDALVVPFAKMIDEMTPYYQERIRWLPPQQRKIVEHLCLRERPAPVKDLAKRLFATPQSISSQLMDLRGKGYVLSAQRGRESLYEIAEPLMRLCVEVKENQTREPMRLLVDFLRVWYDERGLTARLQGCEEGSLGRAYWQAAIARNKAFGNLRMNLMVEDFRYELGEEKSAEWLPLVKSYAEESEELALACGEWAKGNIDDAISILTEIIKNEEDQSPTVRASACILGGVMYFSVGVLEQSAIMLEKMSEISDAPIKLIANARCSLGVVYEQLGEYEKAKDSYDAIIKLAHAPVPDIATAHNNRGLIYQESGEYDKALAGFNFVIELPDAPKEEIIRALINRSDFYGKAGNLQGKIADCSVIIKSHDAFDEDIATAYYKRGDAYSKLGNYKEAIADFTAYISFPDMPIKQFSIALISRANLHLKLTNTEQAITDFDVIISLPETPIELRVLSLIGRAHAYIELGKFDEASADLDTIFYLPNVPEAQIKLAQAGMEIAHKIADLKCAEQNFDTYFSGSEVPLITRIDAKLDLAQIRIMTGRWDAALSTLAEGLALGAKENIPMLGRENERGEHGSESFLVYAGNSLAIIAAFFTSSLAPTIRRERAAELLRIYAAHDALTALGEALTRHLGVMYRAAEGLPAADNLELWATAWEDAGRDQEAFRLPLRIFRTGIDFLKAGGKDHGILLDLNQEERKILQQALDLE